MLNLAIASGTFLMIFLIFCAISIGSRLDDPPLRDAEVIFLKNFFILNFLFFCMTPLLSIGVDSVGLVASLVATLLAIFVVTLVVFVFELKSTGFSTTSSSCFALDIFFKLTFDDLGVDLPREG